MEAPEDGGGSGELEGPSLSELCAQLLRTRDAGGRLLVGQELLRRLRAPGPSAGASGPEAELDEADLSRVVDELTSWLPASHCKQSASLLECRWVMWNMFRESGGIQKKDCVSPV